MLLTFTTRPINQYAIIQTEPTEAQIIDTIFRLPEVNARQVYVKKKTRGKRKLSCMIELMSETPNIRYYWVKVVEDNGMALTTHFNFHVYPKNFEIKYYDIANDEEIDLKTWRQKKGKN